MSEAKLAVDVGVYVRPADSTDDPDHTHKFEGHVWAMERLADPKTGEFVEWAHVARVWHGDLRFEMVSVDRIGETSPSQPAAIDGLIKMAAKKLLKDGQRGDKRLFALVHACEHMLAAPCDVDVQSVFDELPEPEQLPSATVDEIAADVPTQVARLVERLDRLDNTAVNEIRRLGRLRKLPYLELAADMTLGDLVAYDALLARWERHAAQQRAAS